MSRLICRGDEAGTNNLANYQAAAQNFYAAGADGVETYNYQYHWGRRVFGTRPAHWGAYMWPAALGYLRELRDPQTISQGDRHYRFFPLWGGGRPTDAAVDKDERIMLERAEPAPQGTQRFRVAEDLSNPKLRATVQFKAVGLAEGEALEIQLNDTAVPDGCTRRIFIADGQSKSQGRELPAFYLYVIDLERGMREPLISNGDNQLTVRLIPTEGESEGTVTIDELEVYVYVTS